MSNFEVKQITPSIGAEIIGENIFDDLNPSLCDQIYDVLIKNKVIFFRNQNLSEDDIMREVENNTQGILGYVVRWVDQGIGCSKVLDINNIGLMEDRATCRISSQALANWIEHEIVSKDQILKAFNKMAKVVDEQNANDVKYIPMTNNDNSIAFKAAKDLVFDGVNQPSGYTEPILHRRRLEFKSIYKPKE